MCVNLVLVSERAVGTEASYSGLSATDMPVAGFGYVHSFVQLCVGH